MVKIAPVLFGKSVMEGIDVKRTQPNYSFQSVPLKQNSESGRYGYPDDDFQFVIDAAQDISKSGSEIAEKHQHLDRKVIASYVAGKPGDHEKINATIREIYATIGKNPILVNYPNPRIYQMPDYLEGNTEYDPTFKKLIDETLGQMDAPKNNALVLQEATRILAKNTSLGLATTALASRGLFASPVGQLGTKAQIIKYFIPVVTGQKIGAFALTESKKMGSNPGDLDTTAIPIFEGDQIKTWQIKGEKYWITNGEIADFVLVIAKIPDQAPKPLNPGNPSAADKEAQALFEKIPDAIRGKQVAFIVDVDAVKNSQKNAFEAISVGLKGGQHESNTAELKFNNLKLRPEDMLGKIGDGTKIHNEILIDGRMMLAAAAAVTGEKALDEAYAKIKEDLSENRGVSERAPQGVLSYPAVGALLKEPKALMLAATLTAQQVARLKGQLDSIPSNDAMNKMIVGLKFGRSASIAKLFATTEAEKAADNAIQVRGGMGYAEDSGLMKLKNDIRLTRIYEGTDQIQRNIIARLTMVKHLDLASSHDKNYPIKNLTAPLPKIDGRSINSLTHLFFVSEALASQLLLTQAKNKHTSIASLLNELILLSNPDANLQRLAYVQQTGTELFKLAINGSLQNQAARLADIAMWNEVAQTMADYNNYFPNGPEKAKVEKQTYLVLDKARENIFINLWKMGALQDQPGLVNAFVSSAAANNQFNPEKYEEAIALRA